MVSSLVSSGSSTLVSILPVSGSILACLVGSFLGFFAGVDLESAAFRFVPGLAAGLDSGLFEPLAWLLVVGIVDVDVDVD